MAKKKPTVKSSGASGVTVPKGFHVSGGSSGSGLFDMAGRIAEEIISDDISTGATGDIQQATQLARAMVCQWGMSEKLGMVQYGDNNEYVFLGREMMRSKDYSEQKAQEIDNEVKRFIDEGYKVAKDLIDSHRDKLEIIANCLLEYETLEGAQVEEIVRTGKFTPPEPTPNVGPPTGAQASRF